MVNQTSIQCPCGTAMDVNDVLKQVLWNSIHEGFQPKAITKELQLEKDDVFIEKLIYALNLH
jgi:hypothetical protein